MRTSILILLVSLIASSATLAAEPTSIVWHENLSQVKNDQPAAQRPVLLYITAPGCSYCVKMKSETFSDSKVVGKVRSRFTAVKVDGRKHAAVSQRLKVKLYPTTAILHPSGAVVDVIPGYLGPHDFLQRLADAEKKLAYQTKLLAAKPNVTITQ